MEKNKEDRKSIIFLPLCNLTFMALISFPSLEILLLTKSKRAAFSNLKCILMFFLKIWLFSSSTKEHNLRSLANSIKESRKTILIRMKPNKITSMSNITWTNYYGLDFSSREKIFLKLIVFSPDFQAFP